ncbi:unnamed protein product [Phaeothamnion confervicola]
MSVLDPHVQFRARGPNLVPYIASPFKVQAPGALSKVIVGPAASVLAVDAVKTYLRRWGLSLCIVEQSDVPYTALM